MGVFCILHHAMDGDPDRLDRLHRQDALDPACTDALVARLGQSKAWSVTRPFAVEVGSLHFTLPLMRDRSNDRRMTCDSVTSGVPARAR
jgi:hypothetical protein